MNHVAHTELIRIHQTEQRRAADHHRLVIAVRGTARPSPAAAALLTWLTGPTPVRGRGGRAAPTPTRA